MIAAARTAASIAHGSKVVAPVAYKHGKTADFYALKQPWSEIGVAQKLEDHHFAEDDDQARGVLDAVLADHASEHVAGDLGLRNEDLYELVA